MNPIMALLGAGVPLTLVLDLLPSRGPFSREIYRTEAGDASWLRPAA